MSIYSAKRNALRTEEEPRPVFSTRRMTRRGRGDPTTPHTNHTKRHPIRSGDWVVKAEVHGAMRLVTGTQPGLSRKAFFCKCWLSEDLHDELGRHMQGRGRDVQAEEPACAKTLRLEEAWPVPGTESRPGGPKPTREERGCKMWLEMARWWRRPGFILGALGI